MTTAHKIISPSSKVVPEFKLSKIPKQLTDTPIFSKEFEGENIKHAKNGFERIINSFLKRNVHPEIIDNTQALVKASQGLIIKTECAVQGEIMRELKNTVEGENTVMQNQESRKIRQKLQTGLEKLKEAMQKLKNMIKESFRDSGIIKKIFGITKTILSFLERLGKSRVIIEIETDELKDSIDDNKRELMMDTKEETFVVKSSDWLKYPYNLKNYHLAYIPDLPHQKRIDIACEIAMALIRIYKKEQKKKLHYKITSENIVLTENLIPGLYISNKDQNSTTITTTTTTTVEQSPTTIIQGFTTILRDLLPTNGDVLLENIPVEYREDARQESDSDLANLPTMEEMPNKLLNAFADQAKVECGNNKESKSSRDNNKGVPYSPEDDDFFRAESKSNRNIRDLDENEDFLKADWFIKLDSDQGRKGSLDDQGTPISSATTSHLPRFDKSWMLLKEAKKLHLEGRHKEAWSKFEENIKINDSAESNYWVGYYHIKGLHGKGRDIPNGKVYLHKAAKGGHRDGQYWYAYLIRNCSRSKTENSDGDDKVMIEFLEKAANQDHPEAMKLLGFTFIKRRKEEGKDWLEKSKKAKNSERNVKHLPTKPMKNSTGIDAKPVVNSSRIPIRKRSAQRLPITIT